LRSPALRRAPPAFQCRRPTAALSPTRSTSSSRATPRAGTHPRALCSGLLHKTTSESAEHKPRERRDPSHELRQRAGGGRAAAHCIDRQNSVGGRVLSSPRSRTRAPPTRLCPCRSCRHRLRSGGLLVRHAPARRGDAPARAGPGGDGAAAGVSASGAHRHWADGAEQGCRPPLQPCCRPLRRPPCARSNRNGGEDWSEGEASELMAPVAPLG
jgi:hypothetical protein